MRNKQKSQNESIKVMVECTVSSQDQGDKLQGEKTRKMQQ